jgi:hypothetical protein
VGAPILLRADLKGFFPSITLPRVQRFLADRLALTDDLARLLTEFFSPLDTLTEGVCASPFLANLVCLDLDTDLTQLAAQTRSAYSRYADDLSFSGQAVPTRIQLVSACHRQGFELSPKKFRITRPGQAHYVTGLSITDPSGPRAPRAFKRRIRQELYYSRRFGLDNHIAKARYRLLQYGVNNLDGRLRFLAGIEPTLFKKLYPIWMDILSANRSQPGPNYFGSASILPVRLFGFVDTTQLVDDRTAMALVLTQDISRLNEAGHTLLSELASDPWTPGRQKDAFTLHYSSNHEDIRERYVKKLASLSLRVYVVIASLSATRTYCDLLKALLIDRTKAQPNGHFGVICEQDPELRSCDLEATATEISLLARERAPAFPFSISIGVGTKSNVSLASADYFLGVLRSYQATHRAEVDVLRFERLREKYRLIADLDLNERWHRRRPYFPQ